MATTAPKSGLTRPLLPPTASLTGPSSNASVAYGRPNAMSTLTTNCATFLGAGRALIGLACIFAPVTTGSLFFLELPPSVLLVPRLLGVREVTLACLTLLAARRQAISARTDTPESAEKETGNLRSVLWGNVLNDMSDVVVCTLMWLGGSLRWEAALGFGGGAAVFMSIGELGLWKM
ncbi:hypothetical protein GQ53DRAFT_817288 [Thozetella sp. PMI_491]|nr:hypothetical protein GQ53DRAFT_817288 [Thozetella sp. PMI_491]